MHFIRRAASRAIAAAPASSGFVRAAAPRSASTPFAIRQQTAVISAFRRFNSTETKTSEESEQSIVDSAVSSASETTSTEASEQSIVDSDVSSASETTSTEAWEQSSNASPVGHPKEKVQQTSSRDRPHIQPNNSIYIGNLIFEATPEELEKEFSPFGEIKSVRIAQDARGLSKGFAYVEFTNVQSATAAIRERDLFDFQGRRIIVNYMAKSRSKLVAKNPPSKTLFIGNLPFEMTDADLNALFRDISNVIDVRVAIDRRTGQPRGFAHADFVDVDSAIKAARILEGKEVYNRTLRLDYSLGPQKDRQVGGSGGR